MTWNENPSQHRFVLNGSGEIPALGFGTSLALAGAGGMLCRVD
jgi:hypothetical protein